MALFSRKKADTKAKSKEATPKAAATATPVVSVGGGDLAHVLKHARITEKATMHNEMGAYVFDVAENATKRDIASAIKKLYSVTPRMVRVVNIPTKTKRNMRTGKVGVKGGGKKAYVYLKKGETITIA